MARALRFASILLILLPALLPPIQCQKPLSDATNGTVTIKFVNDVRYRLYPETVPETNASNADLCPIADAGKDSCVGGLRCLLHQKTKVDLWLNSGVFLGYGGATDTVDPYSILKGEPAFKALEMLGFTAMSVDADMFRDGEQAADEEMNKFKGSFVCANCPDTPAVLKYVVANATGTTCAIAVIGVVNKAKRDQQYPGNLVKSELDSVKDAVAKIRKDYTKAVLIVIGEVSLEVARSILNETEVTAVLYSGSDVKGLTVNRYPDEKGNRLAATVPSAAMGKDGMLVGSLKLDLDAECKVNLATDGSESFGNGQEQCKLEADEAEVAAIVKDMLTSLHNARTNGDNVKTVVALGTGTCNVVSCALGQLVADGLRAKLNQSPNLDWTSDAATRVVIVPAEEFLASAEPFQAGSTLNEVATKGLRSNSTMCRASVTGTQLWRLLEGALGDAKTFPQLSGVVLDVLWDGADGDLPRLQTLWMQSAASLALTPVARDDSTTLIAATTCKLLEQFSVIGIDQKKTATSVRDGLLWYAGYAGYVGTANLVPPQVESRVRAYVNIPRQADFCEDWVGMTVAYTLLVLGAIIMVGYQGYQFWRFRNTLSYVR